MFLCFLLLVFVMVGCSEKENIELSSIEVIGDTNVFNEEFKLSDLSVVLNMSNGDKSTIPLNKDMISDNDLQKLATIGSHEIEVKYLSASTTFTIKIEGIDGKDGNGISSITKTETNGLVDTYIITFTDNTTTTFKVTNGAQGIKGIQGVAGVDGHTPVITIGENGNWFIDGVDTTKPSSIKGEIGPSGPIGNGIASIAKTNTNGLVDTYTIVFTDNTTTTFTVTNGSNGVDGIQGEQGEDGCTPVITIGDNGNWFIDGIDTTKPSAIKGDKGDTGNGISKIEKTNTDGLVDTYTIFFTDGSTTSFIINNGTNGQNGIDGIGIKNISINEIKELIMILDNNDEINLGKINYDLNISMFSEYKNEEIYDKVNLINKVNQGYYINSNNGTRCIQDSEYPYCCSELIEVEPLSSYVFFKDQKATNIVHGALFDINKNYIKGWKYSLSEVDLLQSDSRIITIPEGVYYIAFSNVMVNEDDLCENHSYEFYKQNNTLYSEPEIIRINKGLDASKILIDNSITAEQCDFFNGVIINLFDYTKMKSGYIPPNTTNGMIGTNSIYFVTDYIKVQSGDILKWYGSNDCEIFTPLQLRFSSFYDKNHNIIAKEIENKVNSEFTSLIIPDNVEYVRLTILCNSYDKYKYHQIECNPTGSFSGYYEPLETIWKLSKEYYDIITNINEKNSIHIYLPSEICIATGRCIELYNNQIVLEYDKYYIQWVGPGRAYENKFSIEGHKSLEGTKQQLTLNILNNDLKIIESRTCILNFVSPIIEDKQLIIPIGDSLTNNKPWLNEVLNLSNNQILFRGTCGSGDKSLNSGLTHEGRSGAGTGWYNSGNSLYNYNVTNNNTTLPIYTSELSVKYTTNPFWNPITNKFDFDYYCNNKIDTGAGYFENINGEEISINPTGVLIYLGANGLNLDSTTAVNNIKLLVDNIRLSKKGKDIPIYIVNTLFGPSQYFSLSSDGYNTNINGKFMYQEYMKILNLEIKLNEALKSYTNLFFIPVASTHDSENNFPYEMVPVNPRQTDILIKKYTDCVHPGKSGYLQMADIIFSTIAAHYK